MATEDQQLWARARKHAEDKAGFLVHFGVYLAVNAFFVVMWLSTGGLGTFHRFVIPWRPGESAWRPTSPPSSRT